MHRDIPGQIQSSVDASQGNASQMFYSEVTVPVVVRSTDLSKAVFFLLFLWKDLTVCSIELRTYSL